MTWFKALDNETLSTSFKIFSLLPASINGKKLCLVHNDEGYFAIQSNCPHAGGNLAFGWCEGNLVVCPIHRYSYNIKTGRGQSGQGDYVRTYPVALRDDGLYVGV